MAFNQDDIYTSSGSVQLFNEWTPYVSKFDTSSFYNWEQDNLPLYDLEERTYFMWEQGGFATSAGITGLALSVSADADPEVLAADRTVFTDLSSCIAAIPKVVRFPVLVEVGTIGDLGALELHNFRIEEGGSIEIINRAHAKTMTGQTTVATVEQTTDGNMILNNESHDLIREFTSADLSATLTDTKLVHLDTPVLDGPGDTRLGGEVINSFLYPAHPSVEAPVSVAIKSTALVTSTANQFTSFPFEVTNDISDDDTMGTLDISATNQSTDAPLYRDQVSQADAIGGCVYLNTLSKLSIRNCDGPVYVRNFFVDAENALDVAIEVANSDVVLENCAGVRANKAGWKLSNSKVVLSRSALAYRNYEQSTLSRGKEGTGFHLSNSEVTLSGNPAAIDTTSVGDAGAANMDQTFIASRNINGWVLDNSILKGGLSRTLVSDATESGLLASELNTGAGMLLKNSRVDLGGLMDFYGNHRGIDAWNSSIVYEYLCVHDSQEEGILAKNSIITADTDETPGQLDRAQLDLLLNGQHIVAKNHSEIGFEHKVGMPSAYGNTRAFEAHGIQSWDGAVRAGLPAILADGGSKIDLLHAFVKQMDTASTAPDQPVYGRAIRAQNGSTISTFGSGQGATVIMGPAGYSRQRMVAGAAAQDSSTLNFHGPTAVGHFGVGILAENSSVINMEPSRNKGELDVDGWDLATVDNHTAIEIHSTRSCVVVDNNSTFNAQDLGSFIENWERGTEGTAILAEGYDYQTDSYATNEFTKNGCLQFWPNPQETTTITNNDLDDLVTGLGLSFASYPTFVDAGGVLRFFATGPILNTSYAYTDEDKLSWGGMCLRAVGDSVVNVNNVHFPIGGNDSPYDGMYYTTDIDECHRFGIWNIADTSRLQASYLSVSGTHPIDCQYHGPAAYWLSSSDNVQIDPAFGAPAYTPDTGRLSVLDAFGDAAQGDTWALGVGMSVNEGGRWFPAGLVSDTLAPDLDEAGIVLSSTVANYSWGSPQGTSANRGPFRLYFTPHSSARLLQTDASGYSRGGYDGSYEFSGVVGPAYQLIAQNYSLSADCSALVPENETNASGVAPNLLKKTYDTDADGGNDQLWTSGYYYVSEFLDDNPTQVLVDESGADTFANAKNASIGMSNRPKKVTVYRSRLDGDSNRASESYTGDDENAALGFKSAGVFDLKRDN